MKKTIKLTALILSVLCLLLFAACGKGVENKTSEERETELGISYDNIVCEYRSSPIDLWREEAFETGIRIYADGRVTLWTGDYDGLHEDIDVIKSVDLSISQKRKQDIIDAIRRRNVVNIGDCGNPDILDGGSEALELFDAEGNVVYKCGGANPTNADFNYVTDLIVDSVSPSARAKIEEESREIVRREMIGYGPSSPLCRLTYHSTYDIALDLVFNKDRTVQIKGRFLGETDYLKDMQPVEILLDETTFNKIEKLTDEYLIPTSREVKNYIPYDVNDLINGITSEDEWVRDKLFGICNKDGEDIYSLFVHWSSHDEYHIVQDIVENEIISKTDLLEIEEGIWEYYLDTQRCGASDAVVFYQYVFEPIGKNEKGQNIAMKYTAYADGTVRASVGAAEDVYCKEDIAFKEYKITEEHSNFWDYNDIHYYSFYFIYSIEAELVKEEPDYESVGYHINLFDKEGKRVCTFYPEDEYNEYYYEPFEKIISEKDLKELVMKAEKLMK